MWFCAVFQSSISLPRSSSQTSFQKFKLIDTSSSYGCGETLQLFLQQNYHDVFNITVENRVDEVQRLCMLKPCWAAGLVLNTSPCCSTWVLVVCFKLPSFPRRGSAAIKPCLDADIFKTYLKNHVRHWKTETKTNGVYVCFMMHASWEVSGCDCRFLKASKSGMCLHHGASHQLFVTFLTAFCTENNGIIAFYWH